MTFTLTINDVTRVTGLEIQSIDNSIIESEITNATNEVERRTSRTIDDSDADINNVKRAVCFLVAYYIRTSRKELDMASTDLKNYYRELKEFHNDPSPEKYRSWNPKISVVTNADLND